MECGANPARNLSLARDSQNIDRQKRGPEHRHPPRLHNRAPELADLTEEAYQTDRSAPDDAVLCRLEGAQALQGTWSRTLRNLELSPEHPASSGDCGCDCDYDVTPSHRSRIRSPPAPSEAPPTTAGRAGRISRKRPCGSCLLFGLSLAGAWHGKCPLLMVGARAARTERGAGATRRVKPKRELKSPREPPGSGNPAAASGRAGCRECRSRRRRTSPETGVRPAAQAQTRRAGSSTRQQNLWPTIQIFSPVASTCCVGFVGAAPRDY